MIKATLLALFACAGYATAATYSNPIRENGADPFIVWDKPTGKYWFLTTTYTDLQITSADTIEGLKTAAKQQVYTSADTRNFGNTWAPEIHQIRGKWYLYYSLDYKPQVLSGGTNPAGPYTGQKTLSSDFGIDGTVLTIASKPYFVWSCLRPVAGFQKPQQSICISKLTTPTSIDSANIGVLSVPDQKWEQIGTTDVPAVNEAPQPMYWAGQTYLTYSASYCGTANYSIGLLHYTGGDPVKPGSWIKKKDAPVFSANNGHYSTAHNGIFTSPDGSELWNVFHAVSNPQGSCGTDRATWTLKLDTTQFNPADGPKFTDIPPAGTPLRGPSGERA